MTLTRFASVPARRVIPVALAIAGALSGVALAASFSASAETLTVTTIAGGVPPQSCTLSAASADAHVDESSPTSNLGSATTLEVQSGASDRRGFARFELAGCSLPQGALVTSAALKLHLSSAPPTSRTYEAHRVTASWDETAITWSDQPPVAASATSTASTGTTSASTVEWTVTTDVRAFVAGTSTNHGWRIRDSDEAAPSDTLSVFGSREHATPAVRPVLTITYYP